MNSPVGNHPALKRITLEEGLRAYICPESKGYWIPSENYWQWQRNLSPADDHSPEHTVPSPVSDLDDVAKICPETGTIMTRYKVGQGLDFRIDRSVSGGIWLDPGEWEALLKGNLHHELHLIFTAPWQRAIRTEELVASHEGILRDKFGEELFQKLTSLRSELENSPARSAAIAYLQG